MKKLVKVFGIDCLECKAKIENSLEQLAGVSAEVDMEKELVLITMPTQVSDEVLLEKILQAGFRAVVI